MTLSAILVVLVAAVTLLVFRVARRRLTPGRAAAVTAGALGAQLAALWVAAELTLSSMG
ncbi:hypothetical protein ACIRFH_08765 [Streptomyces sp. NPDC093586]|uniref:hypothetical protein n=1 Tax=Streptomyces sp. NPDC093586 TaxID=3366042 RepID=UPI00381A3A27